MNAGTLERTEYLTAFLKVLGASESIHIYDDDYVEETESSVLDQARERGALSEKTLHRAPAIVNVGGCWLRQNPAT